MDSENLSFSLSLLGSFCRWVDFLSLYVMFVYKKDVLKVVKLKSYKLCTKLSITLLMREVRNILKSDPVFDYSEDSELSKKSST